MRKRNLGLQLGTAFA